MLFILATPIGNIKDITLRGLEILNSIDYLICEDTRKTGQLLTRYQNLNLLEKKPPLISYYQGNELKKLPQIISLLKENKKIALVTNSGTPAISDPGFKLVRECLRQKIPLSPLPGPSASIAALCSSGLPTDKFLFLGFLPKKSSKREKILKTCQKFKLDKLTKNTTIIIYESPHRFLKTIKDISKIFPNCQVTIANELTKKFEKIITAAIKEIIKKPPQIKGEITILIC